MTKDEKTSPRNPVGLANSKTNCSPSHSLYDELQRPKNNVLVCVPEGATRQVQKHVCPHHNVPGEEHGLRQGDTRQHDSGDFTFYYTIMVWGEV